MQSDDELTNSLLFGSTTMTNQYNKKGMTTKHTSLIHPFGSTLQTISASFSFLHVFYVWRNGKSKHLIKQVKNVHRNMFNIQFSCYHHNR